MNGGVTVDKNVGIGKVPRQLTKLGLGHFIDFIINLAGEEKAIQYATIARDIVAAWKTAYTPLARMRAMEGVMHQYGADGLEEGHTIWLIAKHIEVSS